MLIIFFSLITLVASSDNTIVWNCKESQVQNFTIVYVFTVFSNFKFDDVLSFGQQHREL